MDGHQRVTTLFSELGIGLAKKLKLDVSKSESELEAIFFDLVDDSFVLERVAARSGDEKRYLPLSVALNPSELLSFQKNLDNEAWINKAENLSYWLKDYSIPVIPVTGDELEVVTESFRRINSEGTPMNEVHMVYALTWSNSFDLEDEFEEIRDTLAQYGWAGIPDKMILDVAKTQLELNIYDTGVETLSESIGESREILSDVRDRLVATVKFLADECHVMGPQSLPYSLQFVLVSNYVNRLADNEDAARLRDWFWATTLGEYFAGIKRRADQELEEWLSGEREQLSQTTSIQPVGRFDYRSARARAVSILLARRRVAMGDSWAYDYLAAQGNDAVPMLFPKSEVGSELRRDAANRFLLKPDEIRPARERIYSNETLLPSEEFSKRHLLTEKCLAARERRDWKEFLRARSNEIKRVESELAQAVGLTYLEDE
jgi:hypothetical protein